MSTSEASNKTEQGGDIVRLIVSEHNEVKELFDKYLLSKNASEQEKIVKKIIHDLLVHETAEEEVVYPKLKSFPTGQEIADSRIEEEKQAETKLKELQKMKADDPNFSSTVEEIIRAVTEHSMEEEKQVLPLLREHLDVEQREEMGQKFMEVHNRASSEIS